MRISESPKDAIELAESASYGQAPELRRLSFAEAVEHGPDRPAFGCIATVGEMELHIDRRVTCLYFD
jgi:hypothetical protein